MSKRGAAEHAPQVAVLEGWGGRYSCNSSHLNFRVYDRGEVIEPERCGDETGWWLIHPDDEWACGKFTTAAQARELGFGRATNVGGTTIRHDDRVVYDSSGHVLPAKHTLPLPGWNRHATGRAVDVPSVGLVLVEDLWAMAWGRGGEHVPGGGNNDEDEDGGFRHLQVPHRDDPGPPGTGSTRGRMGASGSRGRMGRL